MRYLPPLAILTFTTIIAEAEPQVSTVTGRRNGKALQYKKGQDTIGLGLVSAVFGSARLEFAATKQRWDAARQRDHVRVHFAKPTLLATQLIDPEGKRYTVDEILVRTNFKEVPPAARNPKADWGSSDQLPARCRNTYYSFSQFEGVLVQPLITWFGSSPAND